MSDVAMFWGLIASQIAIAGGIFALTRAQFEKLEVRFEKVELRLSLVERLVQPIHDHFLEKGLAADRQP